MTGKGPKKDVRRIFVVDDHPMVCFGLKELIAGEENLEYAGSAPDAGSALEQIARIRPDLAVIDISLKDGHGVELIKQIKVQHPEIKMLVSSMHDETVYAERVLRAGAMGFINKQEPSGRIIEAIHHVLDGRIYLSGKMSNRMLGRVRQGTIREAGSPLEALSDRELEVFGLVGRGLTTGEIAETLRLSVKTIDTYRDNIKSKLNLRSANELVRYAVAWTLETTSKGSSG